MRAMLALSLGWTVVVCATPEMADRAWSTSRTTHTGVVARHTDPCLRKDSLTVRCG